ncbi:bifunctional diguanylate cyclase/phosphodiesterase [Shewanella sp. NIFS-20-20]|uniref:EAL domain-containing protein n=1 Tax=Shewanella sp. NIFS-20-20 TaxID=2853806 RepID=UPI001C495902|nr:EAL domain-containing protein [Shewanella sp. NIFS-20-20]
MNLPAITAEIQGQLAASTEVVDAVDCAPYGVLVVTESYEISYVNRYVERSTGYCRSQIIGQNPRLFRSSKTRNKTFRNLYANLHLNGHWSGYLYNRTQDGRIIKELSFIDKIVSAGKTYYLVIRANYHWLHHDNNQLKLAALKDGLTGLWNRNGLNRLQQTLSGQTYAMAFIDINQFKLFNDKYGHQWGDKLLQRFSKLLQSSFIQEYVFRLSGDEFMLINNREPQRFLTRLASYCMQALTVTINQITESINISVGSVLNQGQLSFEDTLRYADMCMYLSKKNSDGCLVQLHDEQKQQIDNTFALYNFIEDTRLWPQHLSLVFQQQYRLKQQTICVEALLRVTGLAFDHVSFLAEIGHRSQSYLLDLWVLEQVLTLLVQHEALEFAINVFPSSLCQPNFLAHLHQLTPKQRARIVFEITEQQASCYTFAQCQAILATDIRLSIDDFGKGYTNFDLILRLQPEEVKLDASFILSDYQPQLVEGLINALLTLGNSIGFVLTVEGIETSAMLDRLLQLGVCKFQGYLLAMPSNKLPRFAITR